MWGQCSLALQAKIKEIDILSDIRSNCDSLALLEGIRDINFAIDSQKYKPHTIHEAKRRFYHFKQDKNMSNTTYLDKFENHIKVIEHAGGTIGDEEGLIISEIQAITPDLDMDSADNDELEEAKLQTKNKYQDIIYLISADRNRYGKMIEDMENRISTGVEGKFPTDLIDAYKYLSTYKADTRNLARLLDEGTFDGVSFAMDSNTKPQHQRRNNDRRDRDEVDEAVEEVETEAVEVVDNEPTADSRTNHIASCAETQTI